MDPFVRTPEWSKPQPAGPGLVSLVALAWLSVAWAGGSMSLSAQQAPQAQAATAPRYAQQTPEQLQEEVAPIAMYPDQLVAQILAAATFPEQVVQAERWLQAHPELKDEALARAVDQQPWDPSVKALTAFPAVLGNMDKNLSWTSSLGDAYYNQQADVMDAVQAMRRRAQQAGNLNSTPQQAVGVQGSNITIVPNDENTIYVPEYDPWVVYGDPVAAWPGWYPYPGIWFEGPYLAFGVGCNVGFFGGFVWGWPHWGFDWHNRFPLYGRNRYYSQSRTFYNRGGFYRGVNQRSGLPARGSVGGPSGGAYRPAATARPFDGNAQAARGYAEPRGQSGVRSDAFSGFVPGGQARDFSSRGSESMGREERGAGGAAHGAGPRRP
jgi:hypothetical protein